MVSGTGSNSIPALAFAGEALCYFCFTYHDCLPVFALQDDSRGEATSVSMEFMPITPAQSKPFSAYSCGMWCFAPYNRNFDTTLPKLVEKVLARAFRRAHQMEVEHAVEKVTRQRYSSYLKSHIDELMIHLKTQNLMYYPTYKPLCFIFVETSSCTQKIITTTSVKQVQQCIGVCKAFPLRSQATFINTCSMRSQYIACNAKRRANGVAITRTLWARISQVDYDDYKTAAQLRKELHALVSPSTGVYLHPGGPDGDEEWVLAIEEREGILGRRLANHHRLEFNVQEARRSQRARKFCSQSSETVCSQHRL